MKILLKSVQINDTRSEFHLKKRNVLISDGIISYIGTGTKRANRIIDRKGLKLSIGWFDMRSNFNDPGFEHKEDISSGSDAASAGGFTEVALLPNTNPVVQTKNEVSYIKSKGRDSLTTLHPIAAVTNQTEGTEITEMIDLHTAGAVAFSDGNKPIWHTDVLMKALLYLQKFNGLLINRPEDLMLTSFGSMNEGLNSTILGLTGMPHLAEELMIERDLRILEYTGGRLHFANISTAKSVKLIKEAKRAGLSVSCDVAIHQVQFTDSDIGDFDTNFKVNPPLRTPSDIKALIGGLKDGTIDVIVSSHTPQDEESKKLEFDRAEFGMLGLQTVFPIINNLENIDLQVLIDKITISPRKLLGLAIPEIKVGEVANLTLYAPAHKWTYDSATNRSKSTNSPYFGKKLRGKAVGVFNQNKVQLDESLLSPV